jgi:aerobic carbon-monoxide dehydrogenase small subunit
MAEAGAQRGTAAPARAACLAPAPGSRDAAADMTKPVTASASSAAPPPAAGRWVSAAPARRPINVSVGRFETVDDQISLTQSFVLPHLPGMVLDGPQQAGRASGRVKVKLGPIVASFTGEGTFERFEDEYRRLIEGRGSDRRSGSRASGRVEYCLVPTTLDGNAATEVRGRISYVLTGPLAQFSRSGLVRGIWWRASARSSPKASMPGSAGQRGRNCPGGAQLRSGASSPCAPPS